MKVRVLISPKKEILDPEGNAVRNSLTQLGFAVSDVRVGRIVDLKLDVPEEHNAQNVTKEMCEKLLANPLIESYTIEVKSE